LTSRCDGKSRGARKALSQYDMFFQKLLSGRSWRRIVYERLTEPIHLNLVSIPVAVFGSYRAKVNFDLVVRQPYAWGLLRAADFANLSGIKSFTAIEFGVGPGTGLMNLAKLAERTTRATGVAIRVFGFDTGTGLPPPTDYRDHPELYEGGDFSMDRDTLKRALPSNAELLLGLIRETAAEFVSNIAPDSPVGFISLDVDYYSSAKDALAMLLDANPRKYLPLTVIYVDDMMEDTHNSACGELLAIEEFNASSIVRKIEHPRFLRTKRIFKNARWIENMHYLHVLDHPLRQPASKRRWPVFSPANPYLRRSGSR